MSKLLNTDLCMQTGAQVIINIKSPPAGRDTSGCLT